MPTARETAFDTVVVPGARRADIKTSDVPAKVWSTLITLPGGAQRGAGTVLGYVDTNVNAGFAKLNAKVDGLVGAVKALAAGEEFDEAKLLASIEAAAERGLLNAVKSITTVTTAEVKEPTA